MTPKYRWLELVFNQLNSSDEAIKQFTEKVTDQFHLYLLGKPEVLIQEHLWDFKPDYIVRCRVSNRDIKGTIRKG
jgi:hypothetical protein